MTRKNLTDKIIIFVVIIIIFYVAILIYSDINAIANRISEIQIRFFPIAFSLMGVQLLALGVRYHRMLRKLGISIPLKESIKIFIAGLSLIATPGGIGTAIKSHILKKKYNIPVSKTLPIIFIERLTELIGILVILSLFFYSTGLFESIFAIGFGFIFVFVMYLLISNGRVFNSIKALLNKINKIKKFTITLDESKESLIKLTEKNVFSEMIGWSLIAKFAHFSAVYFIFLSLNLDLGFLLSGQIYYTSLVLGYLTLIPSGLIVTESSMIAILLNHGVEFSSATVLVIFTRLITTGLGTILGVISLKLTKMSFSNS